MNRIIRPFEERDYRAIVSINNLVYSEYPGTEDEQRFWDEKKDPKCKHGRFVFEQGDKICGYTQYNQDAFSFQPHNFSIDVRVPPEHQNQGIGTELYDHVVNSIQKFDPVIVRTEVREDYESSVRFIEKRDFDEVMRVWESRLDVDNFDFSTYEALWDKVERHGIKLVPLVDIPQTSGR